MLLPHHIFIQPGFDLVGGRDIPDIKLLYRLFLCLFFLLDLLPLRNRVLQIRQVQKLYPRYAAYDLIKINGAVIHGVKAPLHTILADRDMVRHLDHLPGSAFRAVAHEADFFIFILTLFLRHFLFSSVEAGVSCSFSSTMIKSFSDIFHPPDIGYT